MSWRYAVGKKGRSRVTVYERHDGTSLFVEWWEGGRRKRRSLASVVGYKVSDRAEAVRIAVSLSGRQQTGRAAKVADQLAEQARLGALAAEVKATISAPLPDLLAARLPLEPLVGVYFLLDGDEVVYVGQSRDILLRLAQHRREPPVPFNDAAWVPLDPKHLSDVENGLLARLGPIGNRKGTSTTRGGSRG